MTQLVNWVKQGLLKVSKVTKYRLESGQTVGKLVLTMDKG